MGALLGRDGGLPEAAYKIGAMIHAFIFTFIAFISILFIGCLVLYAMRLLLPTPPKHTRCDFSSINYFTEGMIVKRFG